MNKHYDDIIGSYKDVKRSKLISIESYQDNDRWYLRLVFEYEKLNGDKYQLEIPKMDIPLDQLCLPEFINRFSSFDWLNSRTFVRMRYCDVDGVTCIPLEEGTINKIDDLSKNGDSYCYAIKRISKQMTIEEIEKELGYKINIVDHH